MGAWAPALCPHFFGDVLEENTRGFQSLHPERKNNVCAMGRTKKDPNRVAYPASLKKRGALGQLCNRLRCTDSPQPGHR